MISTYGDERLMVIRRSARNVLNNTRVSNGYERIVASQPIEDIILLLSA